MTDVNSRTVIKRINDLEEYLEKSGDYSNEKIVAEINGLKFLLTEPAPQVKNFEDTIEGQSTKPLFPIKAKQYDSPPPSLPKKNPTFVEKAVGNLLGTKEAGECKHFWMPAATNLEEGFVIVVCCYCTELRRIGE